MIFYVAEVLPRNEATRKTSVLKYDFIVCNVYFDLTRFHIAALKSHGLSIVALLSKSSKRADFWL